MAFYEHVVTLQRMVTRLEKKVGAMEVTTQINNGKVSGMVDKVESTLGQLEVRIITIRATVTRLTYCEQSLQTALSRIIQLHKHHPTVHP